MPIVYHQLVPANAGQFGYQTAIILEQYININFGEVRSVGIGIGPGSCCAAVAINHIGDSYRAGPQATLPYGIIYGNSRVSPSRLDYGALGDHAEQCALTAARRAFQSRSGIYVDNPAQDFYTVNNQAVLFVQLQPCHERNGGGCKAWLEGGGNDSIANPYNGIINGTGTITLHVWFRWIFPEQNGYQNMIGFNKTDLKRRKENQFKLPNAKRRRRY